MKHTKSMTVAVAIAATLPAAVAAKKAPKAPENPNPRNLPNIVFILADDLGIGDIGPYGQRGFRTPNLDTLAAHGVQFMQHYSGSTVSGPSRAVLLTGKHTGHAAIRGNAGERGPDGTPYDRSLPASEVTIAEVLKSQGYITGCTGKWGLGGWPMEGGVGNQGFDYFFGHQTHIDAHYAYPKYLYENGTKIELDGTVYADELITQKAEAFIDRSAATGKPFFLYYATQLPHAEMVIPEEEKTPFTGQWGTEIPYPGNGHYGAQPTPKAAFAAMVTRIDNSVGRLVEHLRAAGQLDNTIIIFSSDNGCHIEGGQSPAFFDSNSLYRGTKRDLYEGGLRTPLLISWPGHITPGSVSYHVSAFWDFMPTFCEIVGAPVPEGVDGISMVPELLGGREQPRHDYLYFEFHEEGGKQSVLRDNWKLIRFNVQTPDRIRYELYNLGRDPKELRNVADEFPGKVEELKLIINTSRTPNPVWRFPGDPRPERPAPQGAAGETTLRSTRNAD